MAPGETHARLTSTADIDEDERRRTQASFAGVEEDCQSPGQARAALADGTPQAVAS
jgi:hypothetical protein